MALLRQVPYAEERYRLMLNRRVKKLTRRVPPSIQISDFFTCCQASSICSSVASSNRSPRC